MKKFLVIMLAVCLVSGMISCRKDKQTKQQAISEFREGLTNEDTVQMLKLTDDCMELLKAKKIDNVLSNLFEYNDSTKEVAPISEDLKKRYEHIYKIFPVLEYERTYFSFQLEGQNDVKYKVKFAEEPNPEENGEAITYFMFNPVKVDDVWYLCVKTYGDDFDHFMQ